MKSETRPSRSPIISTPFPYSSATYDFYFPRNSYVSHEQPDYNAPALDQTSQDVQSQHENARRQDAKTKTKESVARLSRTRRAVLLQLRASFKSLILNLVQLGLPNAKPKSFGRRPVRKRKKSYVDYHNFEPLRPRE
ncbi:Uncharacterized protein HZ326_8768 [Fusarium oxysporum f. sp. albedinis]|nr:Uncharacterized protein HZ326_8768 [Fusarium oxysporum f. sp. albedinis]